MSYYYYLNLFNYKYRLKFQLAMNVYFLCLRQHVTSKIEGGSGLDYVILLSEGGGGLGLDYG